MLFIERKDRFFLEPDKKIEKFFQNRHSEQTIICNKDEDSVRILNRKGISYHEESNTRESRKKCARNHRTTCFIGTYKNR